MDQRKIGAFLRQLRKESSLTQEQLAEHLGVSGRTVSRWENGNNLPDLTVLIELADYYQVGLRELLNGERESEPAQQETETLTAVAEYSSEEKRRLLGRMHALFLAGLAGFAAALVILSADLENTTPYQELAGFGLGFAFGMLLLGAIFTSRFAARIRQAKRKLLSKRR